MSIRNAAYYSVSTQIILQIIGLASVVIIARLLTPEELGVYAIASTSIFVAREFMNFGTQNYLLREEVLTEEIIITCFNLSLIVSWSLGVIVFLVSDPVASFYGIPELENLFRILSLSFLFAPLIVVPYALLCRELKFGKIMLIEVSTAALIFIVTVGLILVDLSFYGIAIGQVSGMALTLILTLYLSQYKYTFRLAFYNTKVIFTSGLNNSISNMLNRLTLIGSDLIIGKIGTPRDVAMLSRGTGFLDFLKNAISMGVQPLILPYLIKSKVGKSDADMSTTYYTAASLLNVILLPVLAVAAVSEEPAIRLFFGAQWNEAADYVPPLAFWIILRSIHILSPSLLSAYKREDVRMIRELLSLIMISTCLISLFQLGLYLMCWGLACVGMLEFIMTCYLLQKFTDFKFMLFLKFEWKNFAITIILALAVYYFRSLMNYSMDEYVMELLSVFLIAAVGWISLISIFNHRITQEIIPLIKTVLGRNRFL